MRHWIKHSVAGILALTLGTLFGIKGSAHQPIRPATKGLHWLGHEGLRNRPEGDDKSDKPTKLLNNHEPRHTRNQSEFFAFLHPHVMKANAEIERDRVRILSLRESNVLYDEDSIWLKKIAKSYRFDRFDPKHSGDWEELLSRVDIVPAALALAQAANESAWGTSRFAKEANNYFGQWCFYTGCGVVPLKRAAGASHEVRRFGSAKESVYAYIHNLNSSQAYGHMRRIRAEQRHEGDAPHALDMAKGLERYSARGHDYINEIRNMIRKNELQSYPSVPSAG